MSFENTKTPNPYPDIDDLIYEDMGGQVSDR